MRTWLAPAPLLPRLYVPAAAQTSPSPCLQHRSRRCYCTGSLVAMTAAHRVHTSTSHVRWRHADVSVLRGLGAHTGFSVHVHMRQKRTITHNVSHQALQDAVKSLCAARSAVVPAAASSATVRQPQAALYRETNVENLKQHTCWHSFRHSALRCSAVNSSYWSAAAANSTSKAPELEPGLHRFNSTLTQDAGPA